MTNHGDDCYYFYYSTCSKGDSCPFRHCEAAMGSETMCTLWQENRCYRNTCKFRHMEIKKNRNKIPCYWETQPAGCQKPHCVFHHEKPRVFDGVFIPPSKGPILRKEDEEEPAPVADPSSPGPAAPIANPANPQLRGVIKAETLENVPSPTHPPVVINPTDDDEDEDDQFSEEGEESSSRIVSPRKLLSSGNKDDSLNFGVRTLEEIRLRKALKANLKKAGQSPSGLSQGIGEIPPSGPRSNGTAGEKENIRSFIRPSQFTAKEGPPPLNEESVKRRIAERLGKRKVTLPSEQNFIVKKDVPMALEPPLKRTLAERLGRKVDSLEDDADAPPRKAVKPVRDRLGLPAQPVAPDNEREVQASGEIRIKTLEEIRLEKMAKAQGQGSGTTVAKAPSPVKRSAKPPAGVPVKTFSEVLHARKRQQQQQEEKKEVQRKEAGEEPEKTEAPPQEEVPGKKARAQPSEVRVKVKTLEEIRKEKAARMAQAREQEVKAEESSAPPSAPPKRRILRINKTAAAGADSGSNPGTPEATEKDAEPATAENGSANGTKDSSGQTVKVKTFEEIMQEKKLRKQQEEQAAAAAAAGGSSSTPPEEPSPPSAPKQAPATSLSALRQRASPAPQPASPPAQPEATPTPTPGRQRRQKESSPPAPATVPKPTPAPASVPKPTPTLKRARGRGRGRGRAGSPPATPGGGNSPPAEQKAPPLAPAAALGEEPAPPGPAQEEEPQPERTQSPAPKRSPVQAAETKVRPKLNVKPSVVKAASQVKLGQKRKAPQSHRSAVAAVKPLNSAPAAVEDQPPEQSCKHADAKAPETAAPSVSVEAEAQPGPPGPKLSSPASSGPSETELYRTANAEQSPTATAPVLSPAKEPPAAPQSSAAVKTPVQPKPRRQSTATARPAGATAAALDDLDELMNEFADNPLDGGIELDPGKDEDDLLLELSEMIDS